MRSLSSPAASVRPKASLAMPTSGRAGPGGASVCAANPRRLASDPCARSARQPQAFGRPPVLGRGRVEALERGAPALDSLVGAARPVVERAEVREHLALAMGVVELLQDGPRFLAAAHGRLGIARREREREVAQGERLAAPV